MNEHSIIDVLVVGAGPAGTALATDLARRGVHVRIIDKAPHAFEGSRAKGVQPRTLEVFYDLGVLADVLAQGSLYPPLGLHAGPLTAPWRMMASSQPTADVPFPNTWLIPQSRTDRILHAALERAGGAVEFGKELLEFDQQDTHVNATIKVGDDVEDITARFLVGADGGASSVRRQLGVEFTGTTDEDDRMLIVDAVVSGGLSRNFWHVWPGLRGRYVAACPLPHSDVFQWMVRLAPGEDPPVDEAAINKRIQAGTHTKRYSLQDIQWRSVFRPNIRLAEAYRQGRVFLAGDAAHVHTPAGAQGMNTGIGDAYNLGWKLGQVLAGADDALLDTYEGERLPIAAGVLGLSTKKYQGVAKLDPESIKRGKDEQQLTLTYHGGPLTLDNSDSTSTLRVGDRAPDADLLGDDGGRVRLFDVFRGPHFAAIAYGPNATRDLEHLEWPSTGAALCRIAVDAKCAKADYVLIDSTHTFRRNYGVTGDTLLLIRPDGYIGQIASSDWLEVTAAAAQAMTPSLGTGSARPEAAAGTSKNGSNG